MQIATILSQQFAGHGLQFFKVNKTVTHVSVARPHYLDMDVTPVSAQVRQIVEWINHTPKGTRRTLLAALAPTPKPEVAPVAGAEPAAEAQPTPEQASIIGDLHWLIHQGHVIEFANGILETAKKPLPKPPPKPRPEPVAKTAAPASPAVATPTPASPAAEPAAETAAAIPAEVTPAETAPAVAPAPVAEPVAGAAPAPVVDAPVVAAPAPESVPVTGATPAGA